MNKLSPCPNCGQEKQYQSREIAAGGGHAPNYLPGLGGFLRTGKFVVVLCGSCGLARFFAQREALEKLPSAKAWRRV